MSGRAPDGSLRPWRGRGVSVAVGLALAGCGGSEAESGFPRAAEPAESPPISERPEGRVIEIGAEPEGLAADPATGLLAVGLRDPDRLALVSMDDGRVEDRIAIGESPRHLQLSEGGGSVLVPAERADDLIEIDLETGRQTSTPVGEFPHDAAEAGGAVFVGDEFADTVTVIGAAGEVTTLPAPVQPGGVEASADGDCVAVMAVSERAIAIIDSERLEEVARLSVGVGPTHLEAVGDGLFVVDTEGETLLQTTFGPELSVTASTALEGTPYGIAADPRRRRIWVTLTATNQVAELDLAGELVELHPTVRQPNTVAVSPRTGRVFVAGRTDGELQYFDP